MFLSVWHAERLKLRHSPMWIAFFLLPLIPALFGTVNYLGNLELLQEQWYSLWTQHTLFSCYFFLPLIIGIYCAYLWRLEHTGYNWNLMLTTPVPRSMLVLAKLSNAVMLTAVVIVWTAVLYITAGLICGFGAGTIPWKEIVEWILGGIAGGVTICAVQMFLALVIRSFAVSVGVALIGGISGLAMLSKGYPLLDPYALLCLGMEANNSTAQNTNTLGFVLSCTCFFLVFTGLAIGYLQYRDAKTG
ncbi:MAG: ABC transporter permease [Butyricicoccus pullicaecorum]|nr:ABC transporter permease [Butyricicoccus pullicaecorum]MDO4669665.1 ABC transporter permease [Butyricicoccus pullicaecorum]